MADTPWIVSFTGHRKLTKAEILKTVSGINPYLREKKEEHPNLRVLVGGAKGVDEIARFRCWLLGIPYTLVLPHGDYPRECWGEDSYILDTIIRLTEESEVNKVVYVVKEGPWKDSHNLKRNEYLVRWCSELTAVYRGTLEDAMKEMRSGTAHTIRCAKKSGKSIHFIDPRSGE